MAKFDTVRPTQWFYLRPVSVKGVDAGAATDWAPVPCVWHKNGHKILLFSEQF